MNRVRMRLALFCPDNARHACANPVRARGRHRGASGRRDRPRNVSAHAWRHFEVASANGHPRLHGSGRRKGCVCVPEETVRKGGWQELPGGYLSDQACSGAFGKDGFTISVSTFPASGANASGRVDIRLANHGNVDVSKLPVPAGTKLLYSFPTSTAYVTESSVQETSKALSTLLLAKGWAPYGKAGNSLCFKKNAVKLMAWPSAAPAQGGKTVIQLSTELMSVDLPAPPALVDATYADTTKALSLEVEMTAPALAAFYKQALGKAGWRATTEQPVKIDFDDMMIFRNDAKDMATLKMHEYQGKLRAILTQQTEAELEEQERLAKAEVAKRKADSAMYAKNAAKECMTVAIAVPEGARDIKRTKRELEFKLAAGKALAAVQTYPRYAGQRRLERQDAPVQPDVWGLVAREEGGCEPDDHLRRRGTERRGGYRLVIWRRPRGTKGKVNRTGIGVDANYHSAWAIRLLGTRAAWRFRARRTTLCRSPCGFLQATSLVQASLS